MLLHVLCLSLCQDIDNQLLGPVSTRNLLLCFLWVLKNIDKTFLNQWWFTLSIGRYCIHSLIHSPTHSFTRSLTHSLVHLTHSLTHTFPLSSLPLFPSLFPPSFFFRLNTMLNVLELCVACFEYRVSSSPYQHV